MSDIKNIKVVSFDCDGVMFDTRKANAAFYNHILQHFNRPVMTAEQFTYAQMNTVDLTMDMLFNEDKKSVEVAQDYRKSMSYIPFIKHMEIEPDLKPLLKKLKPEHYTAVATNRTDTMDRVLVEHGLEDCFDIVITALDVSRPKPFPDQLFMLLSHFNVEPHNVIYIGDSELDEIAAMAAGVPFIAYDNKLLRADYHIKTLAEIEAILQ